MIYSILTIINTVVFITLVVYLYLQPKGAMLTGRKIKSEIKRAELRYQISIQIELTQTAII